MDAEFAELLQHGRIRLPHREPDTAKEQTIWHDEGSAAVSCSWMTTQDCSAAKTATLQLRLPDREVCNIGVFLLDVENDRLHWLLISDWHAYADEEDIEVFQSLDEILQVQAERMGGTTLLGYIADKWSNTVQLADEQDVQVRDRQAELCRLFRDRVAPR